MSVRQRQLWAYKATLLAARGSHGRGAVKVSDDEMRIALNHSEIGPRGHLDALKHRRHRRSADFPAAVSINAQRKASKAGALVCGGMPQRHPSPDRRCIRTSFSASPACRPWPGGRCRKRITRARALHQTARTLSGACLIPTRLRIPGKNHRRWATATGTRCTKSYASSTFLRIFIRPVRARSASSYSRASD